MLDAYPKMSDLLQRSRAADVDDRVAQIEARLRRLELRLGLDAEGGVASPAAGHPEFFIDHSRATGATGAAKREEIGQNGFAMAGVVALTLGIAFMLSLPYPTLPAAAPGLVGIALAGGLLLVARVAQRALGALGQYVRGATMALLFFATLRLFFFGAAPALALASLAGRGALVLALAICAAVAWRSRSPWLVYLAFLLGCAAALIVNAGGFVLAVLPLLALGVALAGRQGGWPLLPVAAIPLVYATYFLWAINNPLHGGRFRYVGEPMFAPWMLLLTTAIFAGDALTRRDRKEEEEGVANASALLNCLLGYAVLLVHSAAAFPGSFAAVQASACAVFLGLGVLFWLREHSHVPTFSYVMAGYLALSMGIVKLARPPEVFVWLSLQSVVVVATAVWLRSRLIVVANFGIFAAIVTAYMLLVDRETGISLGFGIVALLSARILHWQKDRLELKTELMRNAYLVGAFIVFPYALQHLVAARFVALAWVGLAVVYYAMTAWLRNPKYRWMGHGTLILVALQLVFARAGSIDPGYRVASFLALGTVLLVVALTFGRGRKA